MNKIMAAVALPCCIYLSYLGFSGKMPPWVAGFGWALLGLDNVVELIVQIIKEKRNG